MLARQNDTAIADIQQRLQTKPSDDGLLYTLYVAYRCKGMKKEAVETLEQYLAASGQDAPRLGWNTSAEGVRRAWERGGYNAVLQAQISDLERKSAIAIRLACRSGSPLRTARPAGKNPRLPGGGIA